MYESLVIVVDVVRGVVGKVTGLLRRRGGEIPCARLGTRKRVEHLDMFLSMFPAIFKNMGTLRAKARSQT